MDTPSSDGCSHSPLPIQGYNLWNPPLVSGEQQVQMPGQSRV